jgi:hypothetical protein
MTIRYLVPPPRFPASPNVEENEFRRILETWCSQVAAALTEPQQAVPTSVTVTAGGTVTGTVEGVQALGDGSVYAVAEIASNPGFDIRFNFTAIRFVPKVVVARIHYIGSSTHDVTVEMYNYATSAFVSFDAVLTSDSPEMFVIPLPDGTPYVDTSGAAIVRVVHNESGDSAHDIEFDYIALWSEMR